MRIAVIGAGPAAAGVCLGLTDAGIEQKHDITVFDIGRTMGRWVNSAAGRRPPWDPSLYRLVHRKIRNVGNGFVPEKSYFGDIPDRYPGSHVLKGDMFGGLSKFWGASFVPFTEEDTREWPVGGGELISYYGKILQHIRVTGARDEMNRYLGSDWFNEKPIQTPAVIKRLEKAVNADQSSQFIAGSPRLALANSGPDACTYCGHCFYGCYNGSIYSADQTIRRLAGEGRIRYVPGKQMIRFSSGPNSVEVTVKAVESSETEPLRFDKVYLAAGCLETTRIIANSTDVNTFPIAENPMFQVPIVFTGRAGAESEEDGEGESKPGLLALHNLMLGRLPGAGIESYVHLQVYPLSVYLWNHALSKMLGNAGLALSGLAQRMTGKRVYMMLFYFNGQFTRGSEVHFGEETMDLRFRYESDMSLKAKQVLRELSSVLRGSGFHVLSPGMRQLPPGGSCHYAGTLPADSADYIDASACEWAKGIYVCDSASFPSLPAQNHSFTIIANAYRIAEQSLA